MEASLSRRFSARGFRGCEGPHAVQERRSLLGLSKGSNLEIADRILDNVEADDSVVSVSSTRRGAGAGWHDTG
jgi:hypothetical protein